jgi:apolipoprotein N-acyltransferase
VSPGRHRPLENKTVLIDPDGNIVFQFLKAHPTPGPEMAMAQRTDEISPVHETPYGRLSSAICFDMDFPRLLAQAGRQKVDILLSPVSDWTAIDPRHTEMAQFRAIEQGFNLVRQANLGLPAAYDYEGRTLAAMDDSHSNDFSLVAYVPTRGVRTLYGQFGDWFAWICVSALVIFVLLVLYRRWKTA